MFSLIAQGKIKCEQLKLLVENLCEINATYTHDAHLRHHELIALLAEVDELHRTFEEVARKILDDTEMTHFSRSPCPSPENPEELLR